MSNLVDYDEKETQSHIKKVDASDRLPLEKLPWELFVWNVIQISSPVHCCSTEQLPKQNTNSSNTATFNNNNNNNPET